MLKAGIVTPDSSAWTIPMFIATDNDWKQRFFVDYRRVNKTMKADRWIISKKQEILDDLVVSRIFYKLVLFSGYWKVRLTEACKEGTTFVWRFGTFKFEIMPSGPMNAPSTFQRMVGRVSADLPFMSV